MASELFKKTEGKLYNYKNIDKHINIIKLHIKEIDEDIYDDGLSYGDKPSPTFKITSTVESHAIQREKDGSSEMIDKLNKKIKKLEYDKQIMDEALSTLNDLEMKFFKLRYNSSTKMTINRIASELYVGNNKCVDLRKSVVMKISKYLFPLENDF